MCMCGVCVGLDGCALLGFCWLVTHELKQNIERGFLHTDMCYVCRSVCTPYIRVTTTIHLLLVITLPKVGKKVNLMVALHVGVLHFAGVRVRGSNTIYYYPPKRHTYCREGGREGISDHVRMRCRSIAPYYVCYTQLQYPGQYYCHHHRHPYPFIPTNYCMYVG